MHFSATFTPYRTFNFFCKPSHAENTRLKCHKHATFGYIQPYIIPFHTYIVTITNKYKKIPAETNRRVPENHRNACNPHIFSLFFPHVFCIYRLSSSVPSTNPLLYKKTYKRINKMCHVTSLIFI